MKNYVVFILLLILSVNFISCEKDEDDQFIVNYDSRFRFNNIEIIENCPEYFFNQIVPIKISFYDYYDGTQIDLNGQTYYVRPVFRYLEMKKGDFQYTESWSESNNTLTIEIEEFDDVFEADLCFSWELKDGEEWKTVKDVRTYETVSIKNYPLEEINNFVESYSFDELAEVSIYYTPSIMFNYAMDEKIKLNSTDFYVIPKVEEAGILDEDGVEISTELLWNEQKDCLTIKPTEVLNENSKYKVYLSNSMDMYYGSVQKKLSFNTNKTSYSAYDERFFWTKSGNSSNLIDTENIEYSYPIVNQYNFLPSENDKGYIKLKYSQEDITGTPDQSINYSIRLIDIAGIDTFEYDVNYSDRYFSYKIEDKLSNSTIYKTELLKSINNVETKIFQYHFRTSSFNTFDEKMSSLFISYGYRWGEDDSHLYEVGNTVKGDELFDIYEITQLIKFTIDLGNYDWYQEYDFLYMYEGMHETTLRLTNRETSIYGAPPVNVMYIRQAGEQAQLTSSHIENQIATWDDYATIAGFVCKVQQVTFNDISDLRNQIYDNNMHSDWAEFIKDLSVDADSEGVINYKIKYILPGDELSSEKEYIISW